jgi:putative transcriptional regulator
MSRKAHDKIMSGLQEALAHAKGSRTAAKTHHVKVREVNVRQARNKLGLTQSRFAETFGVSLKTVQKWEQGLRRPTGAARVLLAVIDHDAKLVQAALSN